MSYSKPLRVTLLATVIGMMLAVPPMQGRTVFWIGLLVIALNLSIHFLDGGSLYDVSVWWQIGFVYIVLVEGIFGAERIVAQVPVESYNTAACLLTGSMAAWLLGYSLVKQTGATETRGFAGAIPRHPAVAGGSADSMVVKRRLLSFGFVIAAAVALFLVLYHGWYGAYLARGKWGVRSMLGSGSVGDMDFRGPAELVMFYLRVIMMQFVPVLIGYYVCVVRRGRGWTALLLSSPFLVLAFLAGTRFVFATAFLGFLVACGYLFIPGRRGAWRLVLLGAAAVALTFVQLFVRGGAFSLARAESGFQTQDYTQVEGVVVTLARYVEYMRHHSPLWGTETGLLLYWWIPRFLWPDKPGLAGYWLIREIGKVGSGHSASASFAYSTFLDFGYHIGMLLNALWGVLFALLNKVVSRAESDVSNPARMLAGLALATAMFSVRSLHTSLYNFMPLLVCYLVARRMLFAREVVTNPEETTRPRAAFGMPGETLPAQGVRDERPV